MQLPDKSNDAGQKPGKKTPGLVMTAAVIVIVVTLAFALIFGLGVVGGRKSTTTTSTITESQTVLQTQQVTQTQTVLATTSLPASTEILTATSVSVSKTIVTLPVTESLTTTGTSTVYATSTVTITPSSSTTAAVILLHQGSQIDFVAGQASANVGQGDITPGFNGFFVVTWQTNVSTPVHWVLLGNAVSETSYSQPSGGVEFPVQAEIPYSLTVYNDACTPALCNNAFNVTASVVYEY